MNVSSLHLKQYPAHLKFLSTQNLRTGSLPGESEAKSESILHPSEEHTQSPIPGPRVKVRRSNDFNIHTPPSGFLEMKCRNRKI
ncbi:hypothetical protein CDAR_468291 [Caerostris darwini]|uniref:Uncharacterized protein n=1 Tax=Caerostris darwini TaxID=1538125 RepID=A0AAV4WUW8_9ARAC|nr:hypothetical protein CDAR_468291 [Caerostris darwini]